MLSAHRYDTGFGGIICERQEPALLCKARLLSLQLVPLKLSQ